MRLRAFVCASAALAFLLLSGPAQAQTPSQETWSIEGDVGWDVPVSGNILSAAIGRAFDQATIINSQSVRRHLWNGGPVGRRGGLSAGRSE